MEVIVMNLAIHFSYFRVGRARQIKAQDASKFVGRGVPIGGIFRHEATQDELDCGGELLPRALFIRKSGVLIA